ncbi:MAG TPA: hypothetical protein VLG27_02745 [Candidatus Saccharimonadia bacterium]|nr:hypothetical protein [Candidatus Saccharimonadia bacterium]
MDAAVFGASDAQKVPSLMLAVGFVLFLATIYHVFYGIMSIARFYGFRLKRQNRFALYFTGVAGVLAALQSIGELSGRDIAVMVPLAAIGYLYSSYGSKLYNVNHGSE